MSARELRVLDLLASLRAADIEFLVFGAVALAFYGHVRATQDLDVIVNPETRNLDRLAAWLAEHDARLALNPDRRFGDDEVAAVRRGANATLITDLGQLDVVQRLPGLAQWPVLRAAAEEYRIDDGTVWVIDRQTLLRRKRARGTTQDLADAEAIERLSS